MRRTRQGRPEALVSRATLLASLPVVKIRRQSTAFSMTEISTCIMMTSSQARETEAMCVSLISSTQLVAHAPTVTKMLIQIMVGGVHDSQASKQASKQEQP